MIKEILQKVLLKDVMSAPVFTVTESDDFSFVKEKFELHGIRHLPVVDELGRLSGLITQRDLFKIHSPRKLEDGSWYYDKDLLDGFILKNVMLREVFTLKPESTLEEAIRSMLFFKYGCIPIVDEHRVPVGIITRDNIFQSLLTK